MWLVIEKFLRLLFEHQQKEGPTAFFSVRKLGEHLGMELSYSLEIVQELDSDGLVNGEISGDWTQGDVKMTIGGKKWIRANQTKSEIQFNLLEKLSFQPRAEKVK